jgi:hypothetical protein
MAGSTANPTKIRIATSLIRERTFRRRSGGRVSAVPGRGCVAAGFRTIVANCARRSAGPIELLAVTGKSGYLFFQIQLGCTENEHPSRGRK